MRAPVASKIAFATAGGIAVIAFWIRAGERSGPVKNGEATVFATTRAFGTRPSSSFR